MTVPPTQGSYRERHAARLAEDDAALWRFRRAVSRVAVSVKKQLRSRHVRIEYRPPYGA